LNKTIALTKFNYHYLLGLYSGTLSYPLALSKGVYILSYIGIGVPNKLGASPDAQGFISHLS
jgi:hypothetical protein